MKKPTAPAPEEDAEEEIEDVEEEDTEDTPTAEPKVLRAEWLTELETKWSGLEGRINESLSSLEKRVSDRLAGLGKPADPPKSETETETKIDLPKEELSPAPPVRPLLGFLTKAPRRR